MKTRIKLMSRSEKSNLMNIMFLLFSLLFFSNNVYSFEIETPVDHIFPYCEIDGIKYKYDPETLTATVIDSWHVRYKSTAEYSYYYVPLTQGYATMSSVTIPSTIIPPGETQEYTVTKISHAFLFPPSYYEVFSSPQEVSIPETIEEIYFSFESCNKLKEFNLKNVRYIDSHSLRFCLNLESFQINDNNPAYSVRDGMLYNKAGDTLLIVPPGRDKISHKLEIPEGTTHIRYGAVRGNIEEVICPSTLVSIENMAFSDSWLSLRSISFNKGLKIIGAVAFTHCRNITDISLPEGLEEIGDGAFEGCPLRPVIIPASVRVADNPFDQDVSLIFLGTTPPDADNVPFPRQPGNTGTLIVPKEALQAYKEHVFWGKYNLILGYTNMDELESLLAGLLASVSSPYHQATPAPIFDIQGRKLNQVPNKGLYIKNKKKWLK